MILAWLAIVFLVYCFTVQTLTLFLTRRAIATLKSNTAITFRHEIPSEKFGSYGKHLRWLTANAQEIPAELHRSVQVIKRIEQSAWLSMAITSAFYIWYNLTK